jgi:peptide/nickel transport system substrate-binding protein
MTTRRNRWLVLSLAALVALPACGGSDGGSGGGSSDAKPGGTLYILTQAEAITHLDPQRNYTGSDLAFAGSTMHRTLTTYKYAEGDEGSAITPDLATDTGTASADAKTWSFTLRDGATFEDGSAITCADVAYGVSRTFAQDVITDGPTYAISYLDIEDGAYPGPYTATADQQAAFDKAVECKDKTITFHLKVPVADFNYTVTLLSFSPVPKAADKGEGYDTAPVSSGPYKIESYETGKSLVLVRNDKWSKDSDPVRKAYPDKIVYQFALDPAVVDERMIADAGDDQTAVSADGILPENLQTIFTDDRFKDRRRDGYDPFVTYTAFNVKAVPCLEIRQAVWLANDREALRTAAGGPYTGDFADGFIKPALAADYSPNKLLEGLNKDGKPNVEAAKAKLEEAKTKCPDVYKRATTDGLTFDFGDSPTGQKLFAIRQEAMKAVGIVLKPNAIEPSKYYPTVMNPETQGDMSGSGWAPDWANASTIIPELFADGGFNLSQNSEDPLYADFQTKIDAARAETDRAKQGKMWKELNQFVVDQLWAIPGTFTKRQDLWGSKLGNTYGWGPFGSYNFGDIYVKS